MNAKREMTKAKTPSLGRRAGRAVVRTALTLGFAAIAVLALQFGTDELNRRADAAPAPEAAPVMTVATTQIKEQSGYKIARAFVGQVEARRTVAVSFELSGRLDEIYVDEGDTIAKGARIATLDTRLLSADRDRLSASQSALEAQLRFALQTVERQSQLNTQGFASQARLEEALSRSDELRARIAEVDAALMTNALQREKSTVLAPFDGRVTERRVDGGESVSPGHALVEIVEEGAPLVRVGVPLGVAADELVQAEIELAGAMYPATLVTLRPDVDPTTRTRTALFEIATARAPAFGQTARLI